MSDQELDRLLAQSLPEGADPIVWPSQVDLEAYIQGRLAGDDRAQVLDALLKSADLRAYVVSLAATMDPEARRAFDTAEDVWPDTTLEGFLATHARPQRAAPLVQPPRPDGFFGTFAKLAAALAIAILGWQAVATTPHYSGGAWHESRHLHAQQFGSWQLKSTGDGDTTMTNALLSELLGGAEPLRTDASAGGWRSIDTPAAQPVAGDHPIELQLHWAGGRVRASASVPGDNFTLGVVDLTSLTFYELPIQRNHPRVQLPNTVTSPWVAAIGYQRGDAYYARPLTGVGLE